MISIYDQDTMSHALSLPLESQLRRLLEARIAALDADLLNLTHFLVVQPGDIEEAIEQEVGFSPLTSPWDGSRYGEARFQPMWAFVHDHGGWFELVHTAGDEGFAFVLLIADDPGTHPRLLALCREYAGQFFPD